MIKGSQTFWFFRRHNARCLMKYTEMNHQGFSWYETKTLFKSRFDYTGHKLTVMAINSVMKDFVCG